MQSIPALSPTTWVLVYIAAFFIGVSKTGLPGIGIIGVGLCALLLPPLAAVGSVLILLIGADCIAVSSYPRQAEWQYIRKLLPFTLIGIVLGTAVMKWLSTIHAGDKPMQRLIGGILLVLVVFQLYQRLRGSKKAPENAPEVSPLVSAFTGILAGFTTMAANASGPIMVLYLLAMRLPKVAFVGTAAWFFFIVNLSKVPFGIYLGALSLQGFLFALMLFPGAIVGGICGRLLLHKIPQQWFEWLAVLFTFVAGLKLVF